MFTLLILNGYNIPIFLLFRMKRPRRNKRIQSAVFSKGHFPVSSETTSTSASVTAESPIAALWRVPYLRLTCFVVSGSTLAADTTRFSLTNTAPS